MAVMTASEEADVIDRANALIARSDEVVRRLDELVPAIMELLGVNLTDKETCGA